MRRLSAVSGVLVVVVCLLVGAVVVPAGAGAFAIQRGSFQVTGSTREAGAHENLTTVFQFVHNNFGKTQGNVKTTSVELPAGFTGSNTAVPTCSDALLEGSEGGGGNKGAQCPADSQVGTISFILAGASESGVEHVTDPLYSIEVTNPGIAAMLGFNIGGIAVQNLPITVRPGDSGLTITSEDIVGLGEVSEVSVTVWGVPAAAEHDAQRGEECNNGVCRGGGKTVDVVPRPFLSNPTSCTEGPLTATLRTNDWQSPEEILEETAAVEPMVECERVPFEPRIETGPTTNTVESPSGLNVSLLVPQTWELPGSVATSNLRDTVLALPVGYTINPGAGSGLGVCTLAQLEAETSVGLPGEGCPAESKIGTVQVETPVLAEKLEGAIYVAKPFEAPFTSSLLQLYIVVRSSQRGIVVRLKGRIEANATTGQLVTSFLDNPQVPFSRFTLKLRQGASSPLVSPPVCGAYTAEGALTPWSDPLSPEPLSSSFQIEHGIGGGVCPAGGVPPFHPALIAGTLNNSAGSYSPMDIHITRNDGEQEITGFSSQLPPGLTANLSGVPFCPEADIALARSKSGAQEETEPSCPAASEIGHTLVGAGVGSVLAYTPGKVYLAGPFEGAPFSVAAITSAKVGPFDLGTVVVHLPLFINPETAAVSIPAGAANQIPHIIDGIVIHVRDIRVYIERKDFMINPTSCNPLTFSATVIGGGADPANPADNTPSTTNDSFQLANCQNLQFRPKFSVSTSGKTSRLNGASLTAKLAIPGALGTQANISRVKVELPEQLPSRLPTLQKACTAAQFDSNPSGCPPASIIGHAKAVTPILPVPLEGPAYFVSHGGEGWPSLVVVLQGYGVTIDLTGTTFISKAGVTSTTFKTVPDQPVTSFELTLPEGPYSALTALGNLCTATKTVTVKKKVTVKTHGRKKIITRKVKQTQPATLQMPTEFVAQNGAEIHQTTPIAVTGCPKARPAKKAKSGRRKPRV